MRAWAVVIVMGVVLGVAVVAPAQEFGPDTVGVIKDGETPSASEVAVRLSEATPLASVDTVVLGRDDEFADSLASGVMQSTSPLLLVPRNGPIPTRVRDELSRLAPQRVVLLGGEAALTTEVADELSGLGYAVERRAGASRFQTATEIARQDAPQATTAILARAFAAEGSTDPTQGFADALAAGGMAAEMGWPVLLTQSDVLTGATRDYLAEAGITEVKLMGGTAAIADTVQTELEAMGIATDRLAGASRSQTAIEVAKERGSQTAADAAQVVLVQGQSADAWAGGFAAAAHSALFDAPIVLAVGDQLAPETRAWLEGDAGVSKTADTAFQQPGVRLTCVVVPALCEEARVAMGLPPTVPAEQVAGYAFDRDLSSDLEGAPTLADVQAEGGEPNQFVSDEEEGTVLQFAAGNGLHMAWEPGFVPQDHYSVAMRVLIDDITGYVRLLDFSERESDNGLYVLNGRLVFYGLTSGHDTAVTAGTWHTIVLTRASTGHVRGYIDGQEVLSILDEAQESLLANDSMLLFQDDLQVANEHSSGRIAWLQVFDGPLTASQIAALD